MVLEILIPAASALILLGLTKSTENLLDLRQQRRDQGHDSKTYL